MTPQEKIIKFMRAKNRFLNERLKNIPDYFTQSDAEEIREWSDEDAQSVLDRILPSTGLAYKNCPFCIFSVPKTDTPNANNVDCNSCGYGERHGICVENKSDYDYITRKYEEKFNEEVYLYFASIQIAVLADLREQK